jgi:hypothetical protein
MSTETYQQLWDGCWQPAFRGTLNQTDMSDEDASTFPSPVSINERREHLSIILRDFNEPDNDPSLFIRVINEEKDVIAEYNRVDIENLVNG